MNRDHYTAFPPNVKLPTLGQVMSSLDGDVNISIWSEANQRVLVEQTKAGCVPAKHVIRWIDCLVKRMVIMNGCLQIVIVYGGLRT